MMLLSSSSIRVAQRFLKAAPLSSGVAIMGAAARGYHDNIVEHYENPRNVGSLDKNDKSVGTVRFILARVTHVTELSLLYISLSFFKSS